MALMNTNRASRAVRHRASPAVRHKYHTLPITDKVEFLKNQRERDSGASERSLCDLSHLKSDIKKQVDSILPVVLLTFHLISIKLFIFIY